jgi:hypothetical protein
MAAAVAAHASTPAGGKPVPSGDTFGGQKGRVPPAQRQYGQARYEAVDAQTAMMRAVKRAKGELPPIQGGLDDMSVQKQASKQAQKVQDTVAQVITQADTNFDGYGYAAPDGDMDGYSPVPEDGKVAGTPGVGRVGGAVPAQPTMIPPVGRPTQQYLGIDPALQVLSAYVKNRERVTLELTDSTISMSVVKVLSSKYGVTILLPLATDGATFIPKHGLDVVIRQGNTEYKVCYPGLYVEIPELQIAVMTFIRLSEGAQ